MPPAAIASSVVVIIVARLVGAVADVGAAQEVEVIACGNFGARPKPPKLRLELGAHAGVRRRRGCSGRGRPSRSARDESSSMRRGQLLALLGDLARRLAPRFRDRRAHAPERGHAVALVVREIRARVERPAVGRAPHAHRPAAAAGQRLHRLHVDRVDVGSFLAVDLHVDEQLVHQSPPCRRLRTTRAPLRGTSGTTNNRPTGRPGRRARARARTRRRPTGTSRPDCRRAGAGTGSVSSARRFVTG